LPIREALQKPAAIDRGINLPGWICAYGLGGMKQLTLAVAGFERYAKTTRRAVFLAEMERVAPWSALCALIEPFYPKPGHGRALVGVADAAHLLPTAMVQPVGPDGGSGAVRSAARRDFVGIDLGRKPVPDETTA